jgi:hypothetical protein
LQPPHEQNYGHLTVSIISYLSTEGRSFQVPGNTRTAAETEARYSEKINHMLTADWDMWIERTERGSAHGLFQGAVPVFIRTD